MKKYISMIVACLLAASMALAAGNEAAPISAGAPSDQSHVDVQSNQTADAIINEREASQIQTRESDPLTGEQERDQMQVKEQEQQKMGSLTTENGKQVELKEQAGNKVQLKSGEATAETSMQMTQEQTEQGTQLHAKLSNGFDAEVKVMPDTASERAMERLGLKVCAADNGCVIELKEVGSGEEMKAAYEVRIQKEAKILGMFKTRMQVEAQVDAENGEIIRTKKPWWAFLASETEE